MAKKGVLESYKYYMEALESGTPLRNRNPRSRLLSILLNEGPQPVSELLEKSELLWTQFHPVYHDLINENQVMGPDLIGDVSLTQIGQAVARALED
jgi:hypothetical protein